jgi:hypothetical protein
MQYSDIWIEAEVWSPGSWDPLDDSSDVVVTFTDGRRWGATFVSYANVATEVARWKQTGECLHGAYFWVSDMILIDQVNRHCIEEVVTHLLETDEFETIFTQFPEDDDIKCPNAEARTS